MASCYTVPRVPGDAAELLDLQGHRDEGHVLVGLAVAVPVEALTFAQQLGILQKLAGAACVSVVHVFRGNEGRLDVLALPRVRLLVRRVGRVLVLVRLRARDPEVGRPRVEAVDPEQVGNLVGDGDAVLLDCYSVVL